MENQAGIKCTRFRGIYQHMDDIKSNLNRASQINDKVKFAEELSVEIEALINCAEYEEQSSECSNCQAISKLNKRTVDIIVKAKTLI